MGIMGVTVLCSRYPMAMGTLADLEDQEPIPGKESPIKIHLKVHASRVKELGVGVDCERGGI